MRLAMLNERGEEKTMDHETHESDDKLICVVGYSMNGFAGTGVGHIEAFRHLDPSTSSPLTGT